MTNKKTPKVSIIVPVYNADLYLEKCLNSLVNQTLQDIEIICVNDNSKDKSLKILQKFAKNDNRIKIINFKETVVVCHMSKLAVPAKTYTTTLVSASASSVLVVRRFALAKYSFAKPALRRSLAQARS